MGEETKGLLLRKRNRHLVADGIGLLRHPVPSAQHATTPARRHVLQSIIYPSTR